MLNYLTDIAASASVTYRAVDSDFTYIYAAVSNSTIDVIELKTTKKVKTISGILSGPNTITLFGNGASAVITSSTTAAVNFVDLVNSRVVNVTSGALATYSNGFTSQHMAVNQTAGIGLSTTNSSNTILKSTLNTRVLTSLTASSLNGTPTCIITKQSTGADPTRWIVGSATGRIVEIDQNAGIYKTISLPTTPNSGSAPANEAIIGIAHYPPNLLVTTSHGMMHVYDYDSASITYTTPIRQSGSIPYNGIVLSNCSSGYCIAGTCMSASNSPLQEIDFTGSNPTFTPFYNSDGNTNSSVRQVLVLPTGYAIAVFETFSFPSIRIYKTSRVPAQFNIEPFELHQPEGFRISGRLLLIRDEGIGQTSIESDTSVSNIENPIVVKNGVKYIALALADTETKWDIRELLE